jgi:signal transduction histidine kinase
VAGDSVSTGGGLATLSNTQAASTAGAEGAAHPRASLQARLLLAFLLVGLVPMFFAAELASQVVTRAFENNLKTWLNETATYFVGNIADSQQQATSIAHALAQQPELLTRLADSGGALPPLVSDIMAGAGFRILVLLDEQGRVVYGSVPVHDYRRIRLGRGIVLYDMALEQGRRIMVAGAQPFQDGGRQYQVVLGSWLNDDFFGRLDTIASFNFRLYDVTADGIHELFRSQNAGGNGLEPRIAQELQQQDQGVFDRAPSGAYTGIYLPLRDEVGQLQGVVFSGLRTHRWVSGWVTRGNIFLVIFVTGTTLSLLVGWYVSRRLARPLRSLASGVRAITAGDYRSRVEVRGNDEVAELAESFNGMAQRLEQLHELESQLRRRQRLAALGQAAAGIAHEVRNPLGIIRTSAELIRKHQHLQDNDAVLLENVISETRRIDQLITDFLVYVKPVALTALPLRTSEVIARVVRFCEPELARRRVTVEVRDEAPEASIEGDADALYQAALNVVLNAVDAMPGGGRLRISQRSDGQSLRLLFSDNGPGIPESVRERVFDPFFTTKTQGTGLGLAKVMSVMEGHRGSVECRNAPGGGAEFEFILPLARRTAP